MIYVILHIYDMISCRLSSLSRTADNVSRINDKYKQHRIYCLPVS